uniref:Uncharacterized protein n=1 Tax=Arundo donax TaxID=35708 RepID=A0A0A9C3U9_ARUDO
MLSRHTQPMVRHMGTIFLYFFNFLFCPFILACVAFSKGHQLLGHLWVHHCIILIT